MSARKRTTRTTKRSSDVRIQRAGTRKQKLEEVTALKAQTIAMHVADKIRKELWDTVSKELTRRGYPARQDVEGSSLKTPSGMSESCAQDAGPTGPSDHGMGPNLPKDPQDEGNGSD